LLLVAATAAVLGVVGVVTAQNAVPPDVRPLPADPAPSAPPPSIDDLVSGEAPPSPQATITPIGPAVDAAEDRLTAQSEAAARPTRRPARRAARTPRPGAETRAEGEAAPRLPGAPPEPRPRFASAVLQGLDKTTARTVRFEAAVGQPVRYEGLIVTVRACERTTPAEPRRDTIAYLDVFSQPRAARGRGPAPARQVYRGWMSSESPTVHAFGHPVYDLWLVDCRGGARPAAAPQTRAEAPPAARTTEG